MTTPRVPRPTPSGPAPRPSEERAALSASVRATRTVALVALLVAAVALGLTAWRLLVPAGTAGGECQATAWDTTPKTADLPEGWTIAASQYDISRKTMSLLGQAPLDETTTQAVVYATITCFDTGAADSVTRSAAAAAEAGQTVTNRDDLGDQAFSATDSSNSVFLQLRHGSIVVYLAASGDANQTEVDTIASAFDKALGGDGGAISLASDTPSVLESETPAESEAAASPVVPELEAALPAQVGDTVLTIDSAVGSTVLQDDQGSRAIEAALRAEGKDPDALKVAQAYDDSGATDLSILVMSVDGMEVAKVQDLVVNSWLSASGAGVTRTTVKLDGEDWLELDYGDEQTKDYVRSSGSMVYVITTADPALAEQAAAAIP